MQTQEEKILLSVLDNLHVRHESILMENAAEYTPILESIIDGILSGIASQENPREREKQRRQLYKHAREFLLDLCLRNRDYEEEAEQFIEDGTVWIDCSTMS
ncbi:hypothetical protein [Candidatus Electrothrix sp.]|uniref:hypothetical protein n=1 Tax=Candidatus Electrothrix sp. TaxID=2170559 RepID=UPI004056E787